MTAPPQHGAPAWLTALAERAREMDVPAALRPPAGVGRPSAVLLLFGETCGEADVLIVQRSPLLRRHAGQAAFPGGVIEPADQGPVGAALREAAEEVGVNPAGVDVLAVLPELYIPRSEFRVTPVLSWWREPSDLAVSADGEIIGWDRVRVTNLADPANRVSARHPSGLLGAAFRLPNLFVWGFTAAIVDRLLVLGGWARPWDRRQVEDLPPDVLKALSQG